MTILSPIAREALEFIAIDYEAPHTIVAEIAQALEREITLAEVSEALLCWRNKAWHRPLSTMQEHSNTSP